jgi:hypothetical protein
MEVNAMIDIKQAVKAAEKFFRELYDPNTLKNFLVEEVELSEDEKDWVVTVGFDFGETHASEPAQFTSRSSTPRAGRVYKAVRIDKETGEPLSIKFKK